MDHRPQPTAIRIACLILCGTVLGTCSLPPRDAHERNRVPPGPTTSFGTFRGTSVDGGSRDGPLLAPICPPLRAGGEPTDRLATRFAVIGDYGSAGINEQNVATLVESWHPDFVITVGDNNYYAGESSTIDDNIGQYYHAFIGGYAGHYGCGAAANGFFPSLGNHDWDSPTGPQPYLDYFLLPGNERYYSVVRGDVQLFAIDSDPREPDGVGFDSAQAIWLRDALATSTSRWRIVYMHHPPFSSGSHGSSPWMQWPYKTWGANLVLAGHDHTYERLVEDDLTYIVAGLGGASLYSFVVPAPGTQFAFAEDFGALLIDADATQLRARFYRVSGDLVDQTVLTAIGP